MASYFDKKGSGFYYLKVKRNGEWVPEPTTIRKDSPGALRAIKKLVAEETAKELNGPAKTSGWKWVDGWIRTTYRKKTLQRYSAAWTALEVYLAEFRIFGPESISYKLCKDYPTWRTGVDPDIMKPCNWNTALTELKVLSAIMQEAVRQEIIKANPCYRLGLKRRDVKKKPEITAEQQQVVEDALALLPIEKEWMRDSWLVGMCQGVRLMETAIPVVNIELTPRVNLPSGSFWLTGKGGKIHTAPLHPEVRALAERKIATGETRLVTFPPSPAKEWWKFFRKIGLKGISFHCTRVTVPTRLARAGYSKHLTMAYVGHASETVHDVYVRLGPADVAHLSATLGTKMTDAPKA